ncbi:Lpx1p [Sugiyamaella lignohabitans]|uniref:Lpx1p n=1 Tax=Sugiyamaella lignohabitans TaxID=796027 RepID=A0A167EWQ2_9ASCO|nr:Lpx1p [Sugiyamaella lignohabitans]ANB14548.1 Lpx1p [Sugiyamaella lignohabitans]
MVDEHNLTLTIGNGIKISPKITEANYPRGHSRAVLYPDARLKIAYNVFTLFKNSGNIRPEEALNLVFCHGAQMCKELWNYTIELFFNDPDLGPKLGKVLAIDYVAHGDSYLANTESISFENSWEDASRDINAVVKEEKLIGTTILIGHSMGGMQGLWSAFYEPGLYDSVVTIDPQGYREEIDPVKSAKILGKKFSKLYDTRALDTFKNYDEYYHYMTKIGLSAKFHPRCQKDYIDASFVQQEDGSVIMKTPRWSQVSVYISGQTVYRDSLKVLGSLDCEVLHIFPTQGYKEGSDAIRAALRFATLVDIPNTGHLVPFEQPVETFEAMKGFVLRRYQRGLAIERQTYARASFSPAQRKQFVKTNFEQIFWGLKQGKSPLHSRL